MADTDAPYTWEDLTADINELIVMGLVAVTGEYPDERYCVTAEGLRAIDHTDRHFATEARELAKARQTASRLGEVIDLPQRGA